jgi:hypothetical protein
VRGGAHFEYQVGPDGKKYAVGGEVSIDTSEIPDNPNATIQKMSTVQRAAMAPADPSPQDRAVAAQAAQKQSAAQIKTIETKKNDTSPTDNAASGPLQKKAGSYSQKNQHPFDPVKTGGIINLTA